MMIDDWQSLPHFGPYQKQRERLTAEQKVSEDLLDVKYRHEPHRPARQPVRPVPRVKVCHHPVSVSVTCDVTRTCFTEILTK